MASLRQLAILLLCCMASHSAHCAQLPVATEYALHCSGCHGLEGHGLAANGIPDLSEAWRYAGTPVGRNYLVSVPGVASSRLDDKDLAALLNWVMVRFCGRNLAAGFTQFTEAEVALGRGNILSDAPRRRLEVLRGVSSDTGRFVFFSEEKNQKTSTFWFGLLDAGLGR